MFLKSLTIALKISYYFQDRKVYGDEPTDPADVTQVVVNRCSSVFHMF